MRNLRYGTFAVAALAAAVLASPLQAQPYGPGYGMGYGMMGGYGWGDGDGAGWGPGYGRHGWMHGWRGGYGPGMMYGYGPGSQGDLKLTVDQVKSHFEQMIRNPNLKVGDVKEKDADTIVAEIVTKQGNSLVQRVDVNRHNGFMKPEQ
jgi:hypothetical protein